MEEWKEYKLGEICGFQNGYAFKSTDFVGNGENRVVKIKELKDGTVKFFNDSSYITCNDEIKDKKIYHGGGEKGFIGAVKGSYPPLAILRFVRKIEKHYERI